MDKVLRAGTILAFAFGLFFLGRSLVNPLDVFLISLSLLSLIKNPGVTVLFFKGNRKYYTFALYFLFSISLSIFGASDKFEVLKNLIQFSAYTLLIPLNFAIKRDGGYKTCLHINFPHLPPLFFPPILHSKTREIVRL
jgi:hypothetical protein